MDINTLVEGGAHGIARIATAFRHAGMPVSDAYLIKSSDEEKPQWDIRLVTTESLRNVILKRIELGRAGLLPRIDRDVRIGPISPDAWQARSILAYANRAASRPVELRDVGIDGILIEYALVPELPAPSRAAA